MCLVGILLCGDLEQRHCFVVFCLLRGVGRSSQISCVCCGERIVWFVWSRGMKNVVAG